MSLQADLERDEGRKKKPYLDIVNKITIGIGRNLTDNGLSEDEIDYLYQNDIKRCQKELAPFKWYTKQPPQIRDVLLNMCFNLGIDRLLKFKNMIAALDAGNYNSAAAHALDSVWAQQVGDRAKRIAAVIRQGK